MARRPALWCSLGCTIAAVGAAAPALALSITLAGPTTGALVSGTGVEPAAPGETLTFAIGLDTPTAINGYDLSILWDPSELSFLSADELSGLGFDVAPAGSPGGRVAAIDLAPVQASALFQVTFLVLADVVADGLPDFAVFVNPPVNGGGIAPGSLSLANPAGAGIDVPEPRALWLLAAGWLVFGRRLAASQRRS